MSVPQYRISGLFVYPLKSAAGIPLERATLDACGIVDDRRWMLVDVDGMFLTQRELPRMALIRPRPEPDGLVLDAPSMPSFAVERPNGAGARRIVTVWDDQCEVTDCGDAAAAWLRQFLDEDCRLVYFPTDAVRVVDQTYALPDDRVALSDGFPLLLIGQGSLDELNTRLAAAGEAPVPMNRFRPNVVIEGAPPHAEDTWHRLIVGGASNASDALAARSDGSSSVDSADVIPLEVVKPCARCSIIPVDQATGIRGVEPLRTLATYRRGAKGKVYFGQNVIHRRLGTLAVGDAVHLDSVDRDGPVDLDQES